MFSHKSFKLKVVGKHASGKSKNIRVTILLRKDQHWNSNVVELVRQTGVLTPREDRVCKQGAASQLLEATYWKKPHEPQQKQPAVWLDSAEKHTWSVQQHPDMFIKKIRNTNIQVASASYVQRIWTTCASASKLVWV